MTLARIEPSPLGRGGAGSFSTGSPERSRGGARRDVFELVLPARPSFAAVGRLVLGGVAARRDMPLREIRDLQAGLDILLGAPASDEAVTIQVTQSDDELEISVGPVDLSFEERRRLVHALGAVVDEIVLHDTERGEWISTRMKGRSTGRRRR